MHSNVRCLREQLLDVSQWRDALLGRTGPNRPVTRVVDALLELRLLRQQDTKSL